MLLQSPKDLMQQDYVESGLMYENDTPQQQLIQPDTNGTIEYPEAPALINKSVAHDLFEQHNQNIKWSPHSHVGKDRSYLNWLKTNNDLSNDVMEQARNVDL